jgi:adenylosuccinate lyase
MLTAISPIDGRYADKVASLSDFFSEYALIKYRIFVEVQYFIALCELPLPQLQTFDNELFSELIRICNRFSITDAEAVKRIERITNHDVKAVEYYLKEQLDHLGLSAYREFVHFGLTSQDVNNTAIPLLLRDAMTQVYWPTLQQLQHTLHAVATEWQDVPMLARTHGQPASPTRLGKEIQVFVQRLQVQMQQLEAIPHSAKFGGATGNLNAHYAAYPTVDWQGFALRFVQDYLRLERSFPTTQIEHYDNLAAMLQGMSRINTILIDFCRDMWSYISMDYFRQRTTPGEVGSSAMPHKVNPIDFENAEGNLGLANALLGHLAEKLPVSRLQRDLTDSTVLRNLGVPIAHTMIAFQAIEKGIHKLLLHEARIAEDLEQNWMVIAEGIQTILRREGYPQPYEALKALTRGKNQITRTEMHAFIDSLDINDAIKMELKALTPHNYTGR